MGALSGHPFLPAGTNSVTPSLVRIVAAIGFTFAGTFLVCATLVLSGSELMTTSFLGLGSHNPLSIVASFSALVLLEPSS